MEKFALLKYLTKKFKIEYSQDTNTKRPYLYLEEPRILARFAGYLKKNLWTNAKSEVFFRGQTNDNGTMMPSLFRDDITFEQLQRRYAAYDELITKLPGIFSARRFQKESVGALLQHYGVKTPWLDLVDNLYTAIWFATKEPKRASEKPIEYIDSKKEFGWIHFIRTKCSDDSELIWHDLRRKQSSLSLRMHSQHGISATRSDDTVWNLTNRCLNEFVVASVKFPNIGVCNLKGHLFDTMYMFPSTFFDNTYKYLKKDKFTSLIKSITDKYHLAEGELGKINDYIK